MAGGSVTGASGAVVVGLITSPVVVGPEVETSSSGGGARAPMTIVATIRVVRTPVIAHLACFVQGAATHMKMMPTGAQQMSIGTRNGRVPYHGDCERGCSGPGGGSGAHGACPGGGGGGGVPPNDMVA